MSGSLSRRTAMKSVGFGSLAMAFAGFTGSNGRASDQTAMILNEMKEYDPAGPVKGGAPKVRKMTAANLRSAFGGESMAHMRYTIWGQKAEQDGFKNTGRLFRAIAAAEKVHASNHFSVLGEVEGGFLGASMAEYGYGATVNNLQGGINGELFEVNEMYPAYLEVAQRQKEMDAARTFHYALATEKMHAHMFKQAKMAVKSGNDVDLGPVHVCEVCGWTTEGELPGKCPICDATQDEFVSFA